MSFPQELPKTGIERRASLGSVGSAPSSPTLTRNTPGGPASLPIHQQPAPCVAHDIRKLVIFLFIISNIINYIKKCYGSYHFISNTFKCFFLLQKEIFILKLRYF